MLSNRLPPNDVEFFNVDFQRDSRGLIISARGDCPECGTREDLKTNPFTGGIGIRCLSCGAGQTLVLRPDAEKGV
jgi:hypothetical protein